MSVQYEIDRINSNIASTYNILEEAGAEMPRSRNTDNLPETVANFATASKQKYGKLVVFGDSIGEGANNDNYSYVDMLRESGLFTSVIKACVSGATIGPYQTDSNANGYDLLSQIERYASDIQDADMFILEYGGNDVNAVINGTVQMGTVYDDKTVTTVCGYVQKALERLYELNQNASFHWVNIMPTDWDHVNANTNNDFADNAMLFMATTIRKCSNAGGFIIHAPYFSYPYLSSDYLHPNTAGHKHITALILNGLFGNNYVFPNERVVTLGGSIIDPSTLTSNAKHKNLRRLIDAGVATRLITFVDIGFITRLEFQLASCNESQIGFGATSYNCVDPYPVYVEILLLPNDTLELKMYPIISAG